MITNSGALFVPTPFPYFPLSGAAAETNEFSFYYGGGMDGWELSSPSPSNPAAKLLPASGFGFERWTARLGCGF